MREMLASCCQLVLAHAARHLGLEENALWLDGSIARALQVDLREHAACQHSPAVPADGLK